MVTKRVAVVNVRNSDDDDDVALGRGDEDDGFVVQPQPCVRSCQELCVNSPESPAQFSGPTSKRISWAEPRQTEMF